MERIAEPLERIVSGGQTGVDRAALDFALDRGVPCGGWCPRGRMAEDGPLDERYPLVETESWEYAQRTEWNVRDSDGTLILTWGAPVNGTALTAVFAKRHRKPCLVIDLAQEELAAPVAPWLKENGIRVLNVAGPRASKHPDLYDMAYAYLGQSLLETSSPAA